VNPHVIDHRDRCIVGNERYGDLIERIRHKHEEVHKFVRDAASRRRVLLNLTIVAGCCAATLTAAPALGGKTVADWLSVTFGMSSPSWQILCAVAGLCSVVATISVQLLKSHGCFKIMR
jgi:hypothetical protein